MKRPRFLGGSIPWEKGWSYVNEGAPKARGTTRRYTDAEKEQAVRLVRQLHKELGTDQGTVGRVARQLGYGEESVRSWVKQADIDQGVKPGTSTTDAEKMKALEQENKGAEACQ